jgi:hypothetical protein
LFRIFGTVHLQCSIWNLHCAIFVQFLRFRDSFSIFSCTFKNSLNTSREKPVNKINLLEPAGLQDLAIGAIGAGVAVASVYHLCACLAVVSGRTLAMEIPEQT